MLENIKLILGLEKDDYDSLITLFINKVTKRVQGYCNIIEGLTELEEYEQDALNEFIEDKVSNIIAYKLSQMGENVSSGSTELANQGAIKSITRGSVRIEYNYDSVTADTSGSSVSKSSPELTDDEKEYLNAFRRCRFY